MIREIKGKTIIIGLIASLVGCATVSKTEKQPMVVKVKEEISSEKSFKYPYYIAVTKFEDGRSGRKDSRDTVQKYISERFGDTDAITNMAIRELEKSRLFKKVSELEEGDNPDYILGGSIVEFPGTVSKSTHFGGTHGTFLPEAKIRAILIAQDKHVVWAGDGSAVGQTLCVYSDSYRRDRLNEMMKETKSEEYAKRQLDAGYTFVADWSHARDVINRCLKEAIRMILSGIDKATERETFKREKREKKRE